MTLGLRRLGPSDEHAFLAAHEVFAAEGFTFGLGYEPGMAWADYLAVLADVEAGVNLDGFVPASFLVAEVAGVIVGRTSVRHRLNAALAVYGGHIGYGVLPAHRGRGYATEILRQSLGVARDHGVGSVLLTCDVDNLASQRVIERCGGRLDTTDGRNRRYWID